MDHLEAQSYIMPFIEGKIPEDKQEDFVLHMKNCPRCHDELETYYTLIVGMRQLSDNKKISTDFNKDLEADLSHLLSKVKGRRGAKFSAYSFIVLLIMIFMGLFYAKCITRVYKFEQDTKLYSQGEDYFANNLYEGLLIDNDILSISKDKLTVLTTKEENVVSPDIERMYKKIKGYNELADVNKKILSIGGDILNGKITFN